jgi:hypothetical protein
MQAAVRRLVRTQSAALVRVGSQWWAAEADLANGVEYGSVAGEFKPTCEAWPTRTVQGLVDRGILRFKHLRANLHGQTVPHRAEFRR